MTIIRDHQSCYRPGERPQRQRPSPWWKYFAIGTGLAWALWLLVEAARFAWQVSEYGLRP